MTKLIKLMLLVVISVVTFSCSDDNNSKAIDEDKTIAGIASRNEQFSTLVEALTKTELVETLSQSENYTVFAPTNAAFDKFLLDNNFDSLDAIPVSILREVLLNHVIEGINVSANLTTGYIKTLATGGASSSNKLSMYVNTSNGVLLNGISNVTAPDIIASNGVIHVVNAVIGLPTIVDHAIANPNFSTLVTVVTSTETNGNGFGDQSAVATALTTNTSPLTVFAPTNAAFEIAVGPGGFAENATPAQVSTVLQYHVTDAGNVESSSLIDGQVVPMITNPVQNITIDLSVPTMPKITDQSMTQANIIVVDVQCTNGIIHAVDKVLQPNL